MNEQLNGKESLSSEKDNGNDEKDNRDKDSECSPEGDNEVPVSDSGGPSQGVEKEKEYDDGNMSFSETLEMEKQKKDEYYELLQRNQAEFENYRKRTLKEREQFSKFKNQDLMLDLLEIIDNFDRAKSAGEQSKDFDSFFEGITLIHKRLMEVLQKHSLTRIPSVGEPFDPEYHEALMTEKTDTCPDHTVTEEFQCGYLLHDRVIRHAKVKIAVNDNDAGDGHDSVAGNETDSEGEEPQE
jgi:molecular chaperone GrpE